MLITRKQIRAMILREMVEAEIIPLFPLSSPSSPEPPFGDLDPLAGMTDELRAILKKVDEMKAARKTSPAVSRRMTRMGSGGSITAVRDPGSVEMLARDVIEMTAVLLDKYYEAVEELGDEEMIGLFDSLDLLWNDASQDSSAARAAAMQIGKMIEMSGMI